MMKNSLKLKEKNNNNKCNEIRWTFWIQSEKQHKDLYKKLYLFICPQFILFLFFSALCIYWIIFCTQQMHFIKIKFSELCWHSVD